MEKEGEQRGYLDPQADRMAFTASAFAFVAMVAAGAAAIFSGFWWFFLGIPVGLVLIFVARAVKRRSQEAAELHAQYAALERYLKDFGRLDEKPPDAIVLWEQFLIFAVVFGIADQVAKAMTVKMPGSRQRPGLPHAVHPLVGDARRRRRPLRVQRDPPELQPGGLGGHVLLVVRLRRRRRLLRRRRRRRRRRRLRRRLTPLAGAGRHARHVWADLHSETPGEVYTSRFA